MTPESLEGLSPQEAAAKALQWVWATPPNYMNLTAKIDELRAHKPAQEPVATIHSDGYWTRFGSKDPFPFGCNHAKLTVYTSPAAMAEALGLLREVSITLHSLAAALDLLGGDGNSIAPIRERIAAFLKAHGGEHE